MQLKINQLEQLGPANNVEIHDVSETKDENLFDVVKKNSTFLQFKYEDGIIDTIFRTQTLNKDKPKSIVVRFLLTKNNRDSFLEAA